MRRAAALLLLSVACSGAHAASWSDLWSTRDQQAQRLLPQDPARAATLFTDPRRRAYAELAAGHYPQAAELLKPFGDANSQYNRGNALAKGGRLEEALAAYDAALKQAPKDPDIRHNRDLVAQALKGQPPQNKADQGGGKDGQNGNQNGSKDGQGQDSQGQNNQGQNKQGQNNQGQGQQANSGSQNGQQNGQQNGSNSGGSGQQQPSQRGAGGQDSRQAQGAQNGQQNGQNGPQSGAQNGSQQARGSPAQPGSGGSPQAQQANAGPDSGRQDPGAGAQAGASSSNPGGPAQQAQADAAAGAQYLREQQNRNTQGPEATKAATVAGDPQRAAHTDAPRTPPSEESLATQQWLQRIPEDSGELLRRKFRIEHNMRHPEQDAE